MLHASYFIGWDGTEIFVNPHPISRGALLHNNFFHGVSLRVSMHECGWFYVHRCPFFSVMVSDIHSIPFVTILC
jgi:hypothetical protein